MTVKVAQNAGFCYGVQRAVEMAEKYASIQRPCYTLGTIIHNPEVVANLRSRGVIAADSMDNIPRGATVIIRSHGVGRPVLEELKANGYDIQDATCPCVKSIHERVLEKSQQGIPVVVVGAKEHPEVVGILGWTGELGLAIENPEQAAAMPRLDRALVVAQTTIPQQTFQKVCEALSLRIREIDIQNTTCPATKNRYEEAREIASKSDVMLVVGGKNSSNTRKLYELCRAICADTHLIENAREIPGISIGPCVRIGITAGASTPDGTIKEVVARMNDNENRDQIIETNEPEKALEVLSDTTEEAKEDVVEAVQAEATESGAPVEAEEAEAVKEIVAEEAPASEVAAEPEEAKEKLAPAKKKGVDKDETMSAADSDFMADIERTLVQIRPGQTITGTVVQITPEEVCVNVGYKADGLIKMEDLTSENVKIGDEIEVEVVKVNDGEGNVLLSQKNIVNRKFWDEIVEKYENDEYVEGIGKDAVKGGLIALVNGIRTFIPASQLSQRYVEKIEEFVGQEMRLKIIEIDKPKKRIVASRKAVLQAEDAERKKEIWNKLEVGSVVKGIVRRLTDFGAFVDVGGVDGLVHVTDLSWGRVRHPSDIVSANEEIDVKILNVDPEKERISLSYKQTQPRPWDIAADKYLVGSVVTGKVVRITTFGAFIELEPGLDGLVHISQCAMTRINKVEDAVSVGQEVQVKVLDVNTEAKRISLSIRAVLEDEAAANAPMNEEQYEDGAEHSIAYSTDGEGYASTPDSPETEELAMESGEAPAVEEAPVAEAVVEDAPIAAEAAEEAVTEEEKDT